MLRHLKEGSFRGLETGDGLPGIVLGSRLAESTGMLPRSVINIMSPQGELTPFGPQFTRFRFRVVGIFESGFSDVDSQYAFVSLDSAEKVFDVDAVNAIRAAPRRHLSGTRCRRRGGEDRGLEAGGHDVDGAAPRHPERAQNGTHRHRHHHRPHRDDWRAEHSHCAHHAG
jgi:hypothetical protein